MCNASGLCSARFIECGFDLTNRLAEVRQRVLKSAASHMFIRT